MEHKNVIPWVATAAKIALGKQKQLQFPLTSRVVQISLVEIAHCKYLITESRVVMYVAV